MPSASTSGQRPDRSSVPESLLDYDYWIAVALESPDLQNDPDGVGYLVFRLVEQYLPAWFQATDGDQPERVWSALWSLLTSAASEKKPVELSPDAADALIARIKQHLQAHTSKQPG